MRVTKIKLGFSGMLLSLGLQSCYTPPYNHFKPYNPTAKNTAKTAVAGAALSAVTGGSLTVGGVIGGAAGSVYSLHHSTPRGIIDDLAKQDIQFVQYGDRKTLIVPTDKYYLLNSSRLNENAYEGLNLIIKLLKCYPNSAVYVAGFTDNVGTRIHKKKMSTAYAETMLTYLWANDIQAKKLQAEGFGDKYDVSNNKLIHASAQNRRVEIQWTNTNS